MRRSIRAAIVGCGTAAVLAVATPVASAQTEGSTTPQYAPITLSPEESQRLCEEVLPKLLDRTTRLTERINGGSDVTGSVAWLKARAQSQRAKGHQQVAEQLDQRAERRAGRVADLKSVQQRLEAFRSEHCQVTK